MDRVFRKAEKHGVQAIANPESTTGITGRTGKENRESSFLLLPLIARDPRGYSIFALNRFEIRSGFGFIYRTTLRIAKLRPSIARSVARIPLRWSISC